MIENSDPNYIENKIKIAVDSSKILEDYLDEVNREFVTHGVPDAYAITSELENTILENLKSLGKDVKIGNDEVLNEIKKIGKPKDLVERYLEIHQDEIELLPVTQLEPQPKSQSKPQGYQEVKQVGNTLYIPTTDERLIRREGNVFNGGLQLIGWMLMLSPLIAISFSVWDFLNLWYSASAFDLIGATIIFGIIELFSGITGRKLAKKNEMIAFRTIYRNTLWMITMTMMALYFFTGNLAYNYDSYNLMITTRFAILSILITEGILFARDNLNGFYPLQPERKPAIRILYPSNLLIIGGLIYFYMILNFIKPGDSGFMFNIWMVWFVMGGGLAYAIYKNQHPTGRLLILSFLPTLFLYLIAQPTFVSKMYDLSSFDRSKGLNGIFWVGIMGFYLFERFGKTIIEKTRNLQLD